ncbi:RNA methyltransferase [Sulfolobales archaeon HS-7]|nr:RNA methyltransferase [Sulfolobales archaeon HS-7]
MKRYQDIKDLIGVLRSSELSKQLAIKFDFRDYMIERYLRMFGKDETLEFLNSCSIPLSKSIRCNDLKVECGRLVEAMRKKGFVLTKVKWIPHGYIIEKKPARPSLGATIEYLMGYYYIQGLASMIPAYLLEPAETDFILDMAAAPGGKTTQIGQLMKNRGNILAIEKSKSRARALRENLRRMGIENVVVLRSDVEVVTKLGIQFSKILLDAPCTAEGLIPIKPERRKSRSFDDILYLNKVQTRLIDIASSVLKEGGRLVYSTCSIGVEENEAVIEYAISKYNYKILNFTTFPSSKGIVEYGDVKFSDEIEKCMRFYPHKQGTEGFFICVLEKEEK